MNHLTHKEIEQLRYPVGEFIPLDKFDSKVVAGFIYDLENFPALLRECVENLSDHKLDTPYRPEGWTVRQVVHHLADSSMHGYIRTKWTLTEDQPIIKPYDEKGWCELNDARIAPVNLSLDLLDNLHKRWTHLLRSLNLKQMQLSYYHPKLKDPVPVYQAVALYSWHCKHHHAQIKNLIERMGW